MKKFLTLALLAVLFASCSSDDDKDNGNGGNNSGNTQFSIVGSWVTDTITYDIQSSDDDKVIKAIEAEDPAFSSNDLIMTFTKDGDYKYQHHSEFESDEDVYGTYTFYGSELVIVFIKDSVQIKDTVNVKLSENVLTYSGDKTDFYRQKIKENYPNENIEVSKVIINMNYKRK